MNVDYLVNSLYLIKPEIAISGALVLLVLIDLIMEAIRSYSLIFQSPV